MVRLLPLYIALSVLNWSPLASAVVDEWTPARFDWDSLDVNDTVPSGMWMRLDEIPETTDLSLLSEHHPTSLDMDGVERIAILPALGFAWRAATAAAAASALKNTIKSCKQTANQDAGVGPCLEGVFGTVMAFGGAASANKKLPKELGRLVMPHRFRPDGTVDLEINRIPHTRLVRREAVAQSEHDEMVRFHLRSLSNDEPEFLGYAEDDHRLAKKDFAIHPRVPMFRFDHFKHGSMEMTTRDTLNGTFVTAANTGHPTHLLGRRQIGELHQSLKRQEVYDHELFKQGVLEARFDTKASHADPGNISADAKQLFKSFEPNVKCFTKGHVKDNSVLDVQMYDTTNQATFGFGTLGLYKNDKDAHSVEDMKPAGMPLPQCK